MTTTETPSMPETKLVVIRVEGDDESRIVILRDRSGKRFVQHRSVRRGGCLYAGEIILGDQVTGARKSIDSTMPASGNLDETNAYLSGLWEKHLRAQRTAFFDTYGIPEWALPTPSQVEEEAQAKARVAHHIKEGRESFERSDTDGFISQWAHSLGTTKAEMEADLAGFGGHWTFRQLVDATTGTTVPAKLLPTRYNAMAWAMFASAEDAQDRGAPVVQWVTDGARALKKAGFRVVWVWAPARVRLVGEDYCNVRPVTVRADSGYNPDAPVVPEVA